MGEIPRPSFGFESAGTVRRVGRKQRQFAIGDRVLHLAPGAMRTVVRTTPTTLQLIPQRLSFEEAVSIPVVYATAYHALVDLARMREGESVLIHAAAGGANFNPSCR